MVNRKEQTHPKADEFLCQAGKWREEMEALRTTLLDSGLTEEFKWGKPCYMYESSNIAIIQPFKEYCALLFVKGALLKDTQGILIQQTENVQAGRQISFTSLQDIVRLKELLKDYIREAVEVEKAGLEVSIKETSAYTVPEEFQSKLNENPALKAAFEKLTPGRQKAYLLHFSQPKQSKTREARVEKCIKAILSGKGLNE
ncbi:MAG: YdeI/OmpD-associated family protein [Clostridia bacterium]|nr:YdeI/OmpD-associated family protein [Clostridia bacterium]